MADDTAGTSGSPAHVSGLLPDVQQVGDGGTGANPRDAQANLGGDPDRTMGERGVKVNETLGTGDTTNPINSSLQVTTPLDRLGFSLDIWKQNVFHCAVSRC